MTKGCQWHKKSFSVSMHADGDKTTKCDRCKAPKEKCQVCCGWNEFTETEGGKDA